MPSTLIKAQVHNWGPFGNREYDEGNIWQGAELDIVGPDDYWVRNNAAQDGVPNDRTARRGWARWTPTKGHLEERKHYAYYIILNSHPDEFIRVVGPGMILLNLNAIHSNRGVELEAIRNRREISPILQGRINKNAVLNAPRSVNFGLDPDEIAKRIREGT